MIKRIIYILVVVALTVNVGYSQKNDYTTAALNDSLRKVVSLFGEYADLIAVSGKPGRATAEGEHLFRELFTCENRDTLSEVRDSLIIFNFIGPILNVQECFYGGRGKVLSDSATVTCLKAKKNDPNLDWEITVNDYVNLMREWYQRSMSRVTFTVKTETGEMIQNVSMIDVEESEIRIGKKRYQKTAVSPISFEGRWKVPEYEVDNVPANKMGGQVLLNDKGSFRLRYFISYQKAKISGIQRVYDFKIDSVALVHPLDDNSIIYTKNNARAYIDPWIKVGSGALNPDFSESGFDVNEVNGTNVGIGANFKIFLNNRDYSKFDLGLEAGIGLNRTQSRFGIAEYNDSRDDLMSPLNSETVKNYKLSIQGNGIQQTLSVLDISVPIKFHMVYNLNSQRTMGVYFSTGVGLNFPVALNTYTSHGSFNYQGAYELYDPTNGVTKVVFDDIDDYSYGKYDAVDFDVDNRFNTIMVSNLTDFGWILTNKKKTFSFYIGPYFNIGLSSLFEDSGADNSLSLEYGYTNPITFTTSSTTIFDWGIKFGVSIALFQERLVPRINKVQ